MNALMNTGVPLTMSSREIADLTGKEHANVMRDVRAMLEGLQKDPLSFEAMYLDAYQREQTCFELPKDLTMTLVSGYSVQLRHKIVTRLEQLEAKPVFTELSRMDILKLAMESEQGRIEAQAKLAIAAPKAEYVDRYVAANGAQGFRQVAKLLNANEPEFRLFLQEKKIMYRLGGEWTAHQNHIEAGRFVVKTGVATRNEHAFSTTKFTPKGVEWIAGEWAKHQVAQKVGALA
jgi:phage antirepressor YoqD-like protein